MFTSRPELVGTHGMVASTHWLASAAGMAVLEDGGNAFDAAVATGFVLQVVEPHLNGPGGEVPAVFTTAGDSRPTVLCGQGIAPACATVEHYREELGLELVPGTGLLAATVPGAWDGWLCLLRDHGTKHLRDVLGYAIGYARDGFPVLGNTARVIGAVGDMFRRDWPTSAAQWLPDGRVPLPGSRFRNPALADTFERLLAEAESVGSDRVGQLEAGRRAWAQGFVAQAIEDFCRQPVRDDSGREHAGLLTGADLAGWSASYEPALTVDLADGLTLAKCGAWSQGPVLAQQLLLLNGFADELSYVDVDAAGGGRVPSAHTIHLAVECAKLAFADREAWYGDVPEVPLDDLLSADYAVARRALVTDSASLEFRPGAPGGRQPRLPAFVAEGRGIGGPNNAVSGLGAGSAAGLGAGSAAGLGEPTVSRTGATRGDTVHIDVVDRWGNLISATPSGGWLQSSPVLPELGFCLGTRAQMFWLDRGLPNSLAPGKRPRTTLSPSLAMRDGEPWLAFGTPGGDQQDQWQLCFWLAHTVGGLNLQAAIDAPAWHSLAFPQSFAPRTSEPGVVAVESRVGAKAVAELAERGHDVVDSGPWSLGRLSAVARDASTGLLRAAANPRGAQGYAAGR